MRKAFLYIAPSIAVVLALGFWITGAHITCHPYVPDKAAALKIATRIVREHFGKAEADHLTEVFAEIADRGDTSLIQLTSGGMWVLMTGPPSQLHSQCPLCDVEIEIGQHAGCIVHISRY